MATLLRLHAGHAPKRPALILVHGLGGHPIETWRHPDCANDNFWPHWIGGDTGCDVWVLGYDAELSAWKAQAMPLPDQGDQILDLLSNKPELRGQSLILIGHSMGGLVIKTAIVHAMTKGNKRWEELARRIRGLVFVATPHAGSQLANLAKALKVVLRTNVQVGDMAAHDPHLRTMQQQFQEATRNLGCATRTFVEGLGVEIGSQVLGVFIGMRVLVVNQTSSGMGSGNPDDHTVILSEDHFSICKPANRKVQIHNSICAFVCDVAGLPAPKVATFVEPPDEPKANGSSRRARSIVLVVLAALLVPFIYLVVSRRFRDFGASAGSFVPQVSHELPIAMKLIPGGKFMMGSTEADLSANPDEYPSHERAIESFELGVCEVTRAQWRAVMGNSGASDLWHSEEADGALPANGIHWIEAQSFCVALSKREGRLFRLPTEAEWEYACRGASVTSEPARYCFGDSAVQLRDYAWYEDNASGKVRQVAKLIPNQFGLFDMHGNVEEWCEDAPSDDYSKAPENGGAWTNANSTDHILRGGSFASSSDEVRSAHRASRDGSIPEIVDRRSMRVGFRVAASLPSAEVPKPEVELRAKSREDGASTTRTGGDGQ